MRPDRWRAAGLRPDGRSRRNGTKARERRRSRRSTLGGAGSRRGLGRPDAGLLHGLADELLDNGAQHPYLCPGRRAAPDRRMACGLTRRAALTPILATMRARLAPAIISPEFGMAEKIPVTVLTGYLGAGKTTLLNRILSEPHVKKFAVIVNEFGEIGIDNDLVVGADEEIFEMNNGCICCTVRGDLVRILDGLMRRKGKFDAVIVETTGLADPAPGAQP